MTVNQPVLAKSLQQPQAFYAVGEMPVFGLQIGAPRGTTDRMVVRDVLPAGLTFKTGSLQAHLADQITTSRGVRFLDESTPGFVTVSGNTLILDFGTVDRHPGGQHQRHVHDDGRQRHRQPGRDAAGQRCEPRLRRPDESGPRHHGGPHADGRPRARRGAEPVR